MGNALSGGANPVLLPVGTDYCAPGLCSRTLLRTTEADTQIPFRVAGTLSNLQALVDANGTGRSVTLRKNGANGNLTVAPTDTTAGLYSDNTHTDSIAAGDKVNLAVVVATASSAMQTVTLAFQASSGHSTVFAMIGGVNLSANSTTTFHPIATNSQAINLTEAIAQVKIRAPGTIGNIFFLTNANTRTSTTTMQLRVNGANVNNTISIGSGLTGLFEDTSHTDTLADGDLVCFAMTTGATGTSIQFLAGGAGWTATSGVSNDVFAGDGNGNSFAVSGAVVRYYPIAGYINGSTAQAEAICKQRHGFSVAVTKLRLNIGGNTTTGTSTFTSRLNGANGNLTVSVGSGLTGWFEDTTHTDTVAATDDYCTSFTVAATGTSINWRFQAATETDTSSNPLPSGLVYDLSNPMGLRPELRVPDVLRRGWTDSRRLGQDVTFGLGGIPQFDWPVPKGPVPSIVLRTITVSQQLFGQDAFFGLAGSPTFDWPVPKGAIPGISLRTHIDPYKINLAGQDAFSGLAGRPTFDWPVPKGPTPGIVLRTWLDQLKLLLRGKDTFFRDPGMGPSYDYPNPRGAPHPVVLRTDINVVRLPKDTFFGLAGNPQHDWPNPPGYLFSYELRGFIHPLPFWLAILPMPLNQYSWPVPAGAMYPPDLRVTYPQRFTWQTPHRTESGGALLVGTYSDRRPTYWRGRS